MADTSGGTLDEVSREFYREGATDGLPVVPPTEDKVGRMLEGTDLSADTQLGTLGTREGSLTVETVAVNGVMAGCLPIHMPVLLAGAKALADPKSNAIQASVSTGSWAYLFLLNGPIRETLDINCDTGAFGPSHRSNQTISRALGLLYKNCARIHPGEKEMATLGNPFKFSLLAGENEEESPWEPLQVERGYDADDSTITFAAPNSYIQTLPRRISTEGVLANMVDNTPPRIAGMKTETANERFEGFQSEVFYGLCPYNASELEGFSREEIKSHIHRNATLSARDFDPSIPEQAASEGNLPPLEMNQFDDPDRINLFVAGGSGRFNAIIGPTLGGPTTKKITLPDNWETLTEQYSSGLERDWGKDWNE